MTELRSVDPRTLIPNPTNPRRTAAPTAMDDQLLASIKAVGIIQPPRVRVTDAGLMLVAGGRRTHAAIRAELPLIDVLVCDAQEAEDAMRSVSENLIRASMTSVDIWRATEALEKQGWNESAIADALALPERTVKKLKLLARLHPAMLDFMATGSMPNDEQLRTIAAASREEQAQVWKKHKPKKGYDVAWYSISHALSKRRMPFSTAKFDDDLARAYGVVWEEDLFAPAGEDGRYTTNVEGFFGAQQEWMQNHLPERSTLIATNEYGQPQLPKKAEVVYGKPTKDTITGHHLNPRTGEVETTAYRLPEVKKTSAKRATAETMSEPVDAPPARTRPDVTQKGSAMIGDLRTDALHEAFEEEEISDETLLSLLVLAFAGKNVAVYTGTSIDKSFRDHIAATLTEGGVLTTDMDTVRKAARSMLVAVMSCRDNMSDSGVVARVAGNAIGATLRLPNMATEEFLSCLSKPAIERAAAAEGVRVEIRGKDTRARMIERFKDGTYLYQAARFALTDDERASAKASLSYRYTQRENIAPANDDDRESSADLDADDAEHPALAEAAD